MNEQQVPQRFSLMRSKSCTLHACLNSNGWWAEFDLEIDGQFFANVGGAKVSDTLAAIEDIFSGRTGKKLSEINHRKYRELLADNDSEYVGEVTVSGYNTLYFFGNGLHVSHVVFANNIGDLLAHTVLDRNVSIGQQFHGDAGVGS
jgi:hypothetical protein